MAFEMVQVSVRCKKASNSGEIRCSVFIEPTASIGPCNQPAEYRLYWIPGRIPHQVYLAAVWMRSRLPSLTIEIRPCSSVRYTVTFLSRSAARVNG